jgi:hypothetical protein
LHLYRVVVLVVNVEMLSFQFHYWREERFISIYIQFTRERTNALFFSHFFSLQKHTRADKKKSMNANASTFVPSNYLRNEQEQEARQQQQQQQQQQEDIFFAIDVECVATGYTHNDRAVAQIAVVDEQLRTLVNVFVKTTRTRRTDEGASSSQRAEEEEDAKNVIVSTIEPLTGITREKLEKEGIPFEDGKFGFSVVCYCLFVLFRRDGRTDRGAHPRTGYILTFSPLSFSLSLFVNVTAMVLVRRCLPSRSAILVGQNVSKDIEWLGLREGEDFKGVVDLCGVWRTWNPKFKTYSVFSQDHLVRRLLKGQLELSEKHCAEGDSVKSMKLFQLWRELHHAPEKLQQEKEKLLEGEPEPSFAKRFPTFEGVCMGNRKTCTCGAPFFG